jgi:8-oxo-dGTP diphosphatase
MHERVLGAKLALFLGERLVVLQRDATPGLLWAGYWDLPGGGREGDETPLQTALRETREEVALEVDPDWVHWGRDYGTSSGDISWFFVGRGPEALIERIVLGDEGQGWAMWTPEAFLAHELTVPNFKHRLQDYLSGVGSLSFDRS